MRVEISPAAQGDLEQIFLYMHREHGQRSADEYLAEFHVRLEQLRDFPESAPTRLALKGVRGLTYRKHVIFYEIDGPVVLILRVLHHAMDPAGRL